MTLTPVKSEGASPPGVPANSRFAQDRGAQVAGASLVAVPPYPPELRRHLSAAHDAGRLDAPDATGEAGNPGCGDTVAIDLRIGAGRIREARFRAFGCPAATAAGSAVCERLRGATLRRAMSISVDEIDAALGHPGEERRHGPELAVDALGRALESWHSARLGARALPRERGRVAVAMSGGVDSAVAALLLVRAGYDVVGVTMRLWHDPQAVAAERSCCSPETVRLARASAHALGLPHVVLDVAERFRAEVVERFVATYRAGATPNPCVTCNGEVRFRVLDEAAALVGARWLASGHYARRDDAAATPLLRRAADLDKDQSYMLARLPRDLLHRLVLPLGELTKDEVRALAAEARLPCAAAVESQEVCFVGADGYGPFLERHGGLTPLEGPILDQEGRELGRHQGFWRYTVGQRRGIGIDGARDPLYVLSTDADANAVVVGPRDALATWRVRVTDAIIDDRLDGQTLDVRVRYRGRSLAGVVEAVESGGFDVRLEDPADGVAPGQTAAIYRDGRLVATGLIAPERQ